MQAQILTKKQKKEAREKRKAEEIKSQCVHYGGNYICNYHGFGAGPCFHHTDRELRREGIPRCCGNTCRRFETKDGYGWQKPTNKHKMLTQVDLNRECLNCYNPKKIHNGYCFQSPYYE